MSNTRGHDNVFELGHESQVKFRLQSKSVYNMFLVNFLQRRMNTSYNKKLYYCRRDGCWVYVRERWSFRTEYPAFIESTIELVTHLGGDEEKVIGRAFPSGVVWLHTYTLINMKRRHRLAISAHLDVMYNRTEHDGTSGYWYTRKGTQHVIRTQTPVQAGESFTEIMQREWHV